MELLPNEISYNIFNKMNIDDLIKIKLTNHFYNKLINNEICIICMNKFDLRYYIHIYEYDKIHKINFDNFYKTLILNPVLANNVRNNLSKHYINLLNKHLIEFSIKHNLVNYKSRLFKNIIHTSLLNQYAHKYGNLEIFKFLFNKSLIKNKLCTSIDNLIYLIKGNHFDCIKFLHENKQIESEKFDSFNSLSGLFIYDNELNESNLTKQFEILKYVKNNITQHIMMSDNIFVDLIKKNDINLLTYVINQFLIYGDKKSLFDFIFDHAIYYDNCDVIILLHKNFPDLSPSFNILRDINMSEIMFDCVNKIFPELFSNHFHNDSTFIFRIPILILENKNVYIKLYNKYRKICDTLKLDPTYDLLYDTIYSIHKIISNGNINVLKLFFKDYASIIPQTIPHVFFVIICYKNMMKIRRKCIFDVFSSYFYNKL